MPLNVGGSPSYWLTIVLSFGCCCKRILLGVANASEENEDLIRTQNEADVATTQDAGYEKSLVA